MNRKREKKKKYTNYYIENKTNKWMWSLSSTAHDHADEFCEKEEKK